MLDELLEIENRVIGSCLVDAGACATTVALMEQEMFGHPRFRKVFAEIQRQFADETQVDYVSIAQKLPDLKRDIYHASSSVGHVNNVERDCRIVQEGYLRREAATTANSLTYALENGEDVFEAIDDCLNRLNMSSDFSRVDTHVRHAIPEARQQLENWMSGKRTDVLPTGISSLDLVIGGFPVGELTTLASQTGAGKTSWMIHEVLAYARRMRLYPELPPAIVFSIEMNRQQIVERMAANEARVDLSRVKKNRASNEDVDRYRIALEWLAGLPIHVDDNPGPTIDHILAVSRRVQATEGLGAIFIDYDEKVEGRGNTEELRVAGIAMGMKRVAKRLGVPVISLSQYSRTAATQPGWPCDSWLRYSGKKEQESALIIHWYWPHYWTKKGYDPDAIPNYKNAGSGLLIVSKNRNGETGDVEIEFVPAEARFVDPREPTM